MKSSANKFSSDSPNIKLACVVENNQILLSSNCEHTSYALTDTNGSILLKGVFDYKYTISSVKLTKGHFVMVLFKDEVKKDFPLTLK